MSAETYTVAVAVKEVAYHGSRRNALGDIFEHVDLTLVSKLCLQCQHRPEPQNASSATCCRSCLTPYHPRRRSAAADLCPATTTKTTDGSCSASSAAGEPDLTCSRTEAKREMDNTNSSSVRSPRLEDTRTAGSCHDLTQTETSSLESHANSLRQNDTAATTESEKKALAANGSTCSDQSENLHCMAGFRPKECAKRSLVF